MPMMASQIFKFEGFMKTQKSRYFKDETFFPQMKKNIITHQGIPYGKK